MNYSLFQNSERKANGRKIKKDSITQFTTIFHRQKRKVPKEKEIQLLSLKIPFENETLKMPKISANRQKRAAVAYDNERWTFGIIPFIINTTIIPSTNH